MSEHQLGDAPIQEEYHQMMNDIARTLDVFFNGEKRGSEKPTGFVLLVFPFENADGRCNFISNGADRDDIVCLFKEMIARFEGQPKQGGNA